MILCEFQPCWSVRQRQAIHDNLKESLPLDMYINVFIAHFSILFRYLHPECGVTVILGADAKPFGTR